MKKKLQTKQEKKGKIPYLVDGATPGPHNSLRFRGKIRSAHHTAMLNLPVVCLYKAKAINCRRAGL